MRDKTKTPPFSNERLYAYVRAMVERETRGNGDQLNATDRVAARCGLTYSAVRRLASGETKTPTTETFFAVRAAYRAYLDEEIARLDAERISEDEETAGEEDILSIPDEIERLQQRMEAIKKALKEKK